MLSQEQEFASKVYAQVSRYHDKEDGDSKGYARTAFSLPLLVRTAGLVQALAFVDSRGKDCSKQVLADLSVVVLGSGNKDIVALSRSAGLAEYISLTQRSLLALKWYKRFAQSVMGFEPTEDEEVANE